MNPKSGKAVNPVKPRKPDKAEQADEADPGKVAQAKAEQAETQKGKYGQAKHKPHKKDDDGDENKTSWIELEMVNEEDEPVPGERYSIELPDGTVAEGTLDNNGFARVDNIEPGSCKISFPELDKDAWEPA